MNLIDANELSELVSQYGAPVQWTHELNVSEIAMEWWREMTQKRQAEVVLAIARSNKHVLLHTKDFYPQGVYRLPSGGIKPGERVAHAAQRELREETGFESPLARLLGIVEYNVRHADERAQFISYSFLVSETAGAPNPTDPDERIAHFKEVAWADLPQIAEALETLPNDWRSWGSFRAAPHRLIASLHL
jgi:ADP-ribose pyrophosphatase YjhB (NUDIX family)